MSRSLKSPSTFSLRTVLIISLLLFSLLPAATVGWFLYRSNLQSVQLLSGKIIDDMTERIKDDVESHLAQAHVMLNSVIREQPDALALLRARRLMESPDLFEQTAFAMTRMTPDVPRMYLASHRGEFLGIDTFTDNAATRVRISERKVDGQGRRFFIAESPGDRLHELPAEKTNYEPRSRPWYQVAMENRGRAFTPVSVSSNDPQLRLTLAQPVYDLDGSALGVFAVDLPLKRLNQMLQSMQISAHGAVFLVDDQGFTVASSTGDQLFSNKSAKLQRFKPFQSRNAIIRQAYSEVEPSLGKVLESSVQRVSFLRRIPMDGDTLVVSLKPFGEGMGVRWSLVVAAPESDFTAMTQAAVKHTLGMTALILALGALLAIGLAWRLSLHFKRLGQAASLLALDQVPPWRQASRIAEVRQLARSLHDSALELRRNRSAIEAQTQALHEANETLEARVVSRTAELNASRDEALAAARAKTAFLAAMSHEIRTPLNGVVGMTSLLADTPLNMAQRDYVRTMRISSDQLLGVINDVLDFSKIESGKLELEQEPLSLLTTIEEACDIGALRAREKGLVLVIDLGDKVPGWVRGDVTRLRQVLLNLVNNAVKFSDQGQVRVSAQLLEDFSPGQGALIEFRIKDSGIGIAPDRQAALFESFVQVDAGTTRKYGGTGLGLAICKRLAGLMGGRIGLESVLGAGSEFWFTARLGHADMPEVAVDFARKPDIGLLDAAMGPVISSTSSALQPAAKVDAAITRNQLILVADDNAINLKVALAMLTKLGYEAATAVNGSEVIERVAASLLTGLGEAPRQYAAILMDANMPVMDGFTASRRILARHGGLTPPIIALTASVMEEDRQRCREAGMVGFLAKPLRIDELSEALNCHARQPEHLDDIKIIANNDVNIPQKQVFVRKQAFVLIDWGRLAQFREFDDDALSMTQKVLALFVGETPQRIDDIRSALATCDSAALSRAAHALKGAASNVGAQALSEAGALLEQACQQGRWPADADAQVEQLAALANATCQSLKIWTAGQSTQSPQAPQATQANG